MPLKSKNLSKGIMKRSKLKYRTEENRKKVCLRKTFTKNKKQYLDNPM